MSSGLFASYEEDFNENLRQVRAAAAALQASLQEDSAGRGPRSRGEQLALVQQGLARMRGIVTSMAYESGDVAAGEARDEARRRLDDCKRTVTALEQEAFRLRQAAQEADRMELITGGNDTPDAASLEARGRLLDNTQRLSKGTATLEKTERLLHATNDVGAAALTSLRTQTETIQHIHSTVHDVDAEVLESRRLVNQMQQTVLKHKIYLIGGIVGVVLFIIGMIALRW